MDFKELVHKRYSCRNFATTAITDAQLHQLMESIQRAPSAVNYQPYSFYIVQSSELLEQLHQCYHREWFASAPLCFVACGHHNQAWHRADGKDHTDIDVAIAIEHLVLQATELGLGSCWICNFEVDKVAALLQLDSAVEPIALIPIGYPSPDKEPTVSKRKSLNTLFKIC